MQLLRSRILVWGEMSPWIHLNFPFRLSFLFLGTQRLVKELNGFLSFPGSEGLRSPTTKENPTRGDKPSTISHPLAFKNLWSAPHWSKQSWSREQIHLKFRGHIGRGKAYGQRKATFSHGWQGRKGLLLHPGHHSPLTESQPTSL